MPRTDRGQWREVSGCLVRCDVTGELGMLEAIPAGRRVRFLYCVEQGCVNKATVARGTFWCAKHGKGK